mgnify:FL=1
MKNLVKLERKLVAWLQEKITGAGAKGALVGLSGGLDSAVVAVLCQRAFPRETMTIVMPCHSGEEDTAHAQLLLERFGLANLWINLDDTYDLLLSTLAEGLDGGVPLAMAKANLKPRLRMIVLYFYAAQFNYLVVGTTNRSELAVGYTTKYGDGGVDLLPLGNLVKGEVRALADHLNIPPEIIAKHPSGGLWPGQTDEEEMGVSYEELDTYLTGGEVAGALKERIDRMQERSQHKRQLPPIPSFRLGP